MSLNKSSDTYWNDLSDSDIIGVIKSDGTVESVYVPFDPDNWGIPDDLYHSKHWPTNKHYIRWRWNFDRSVHFFRMDTRPTSENWITIGRHLTKRFSIPFWENGHHDLDFFKERFAEEKLKSNESTKLQSP